MPLHDLLGGFTKRPKRIRDFIFRASLHCNAWLTQQFEATFNIAGAHLLYADDAQQD